jgi:hypothetical protein
MTAHAAEAMHRTAGQVGFSRRGARGTPSSLARAVDEWENEPNWVKRWTVLTLVARWWHLIWILLQLGRLFMYKRLCLLGLMAVTGCGGSSAPTALNAPTTESVKGDQKYSFLFPNMTWGACAVSVRGALNPGEGFSNFEIDLPNTTCRFDYAKSEAELTAKLDELAKTNSHISGWKKKEWPADPVSTGRKGNLVPAESTVELAQTDSGNAS